jgi:hypothetical protein
MEPVKSDKVSLCAGDEVRAELEAVVQLLDDLETVRVLLNGKIRDGTICDGGTCDFGENRHVVDAARGATVPTPELGLFCYDVASLTEYEGTARFYNLTVTNETAP